MRFTTRAIRTFSQIVLGRCFAKALVSAKRTPFRDRRNLVLPTTLKRLGETRFRLSRNGVRFSITTAFAKRRPRQVCQKPQMKGSVKMAFFSRESVVFRNMSIFWLTFSTFWDLVKLAFWTSPYRQVFAFSPNKNCENWSVFSRKSPNLRTWKTSFFNKIAVKAWRERLRGLWLGQPPFSVRIGKS